MNPRYYQYKEEWLHSYFLLPYSLHFLKVIQLFRIVLPGMLKNFIFIITKKTFIC